MSLDLPTAAVFVSILFAIQALVTLLFTILARSYRGTGAWAVGNVAVMAGVILVGLRDTIPDFFSIALANTLYLIAISFLYHGVRQFLGLPTAPPRLQFTIPLFAVPVLLYFTYGRNDIVIRSILMSAAMATCMTATAYLLFTKSAPTLRRSHWFTATIFATFAGFHTLRIFPLLTAPLPDPLAINLLFSLPMVVSAICGLLWTAGIAMMITERLMVELQYTATHDFLTNLLNRRAAQNELENQLRRAHKLHQPLSIFLLDADLFKSINDRYGHAAGDAVLIALTHRLRTEHPAPHHIARWGGEEFLIILPDTPATPALQRAHALRAAIADVPIPVEGQDVCCTVSIGVATTAPLTPTLDDLLRRADNALYQAKRAGRNTVIAAPLHSTTIPASL
jgi:diguanylate cyclase (GGDEF)-like protein